MPHNPQDVTETPLPVPGNLRHVTNVQQHVPENPPHVPENPQHMSKMLLHVRENL
ncbi:MAG: hypothetical protein IPM46_11150 [Flavobacteriales bacterium]|nr:hypothetical protein [Flavobacteriales bacterium]